MSAQAKTALVTGLSGFIGAHLSQALAAAGWQVRGLSRSRRTKVKAVFAEAPVDAVIHLATNSGRHGEAMSEVLADNLLLSLQILEETVARQIPLFLNADSCLARHSSHLQAYALSKQQFLEWGAIQCAGTKTKFVSLRLHYIYGPGDRLGKFVPTIIHKCLTETGEIPLSPGAQQKDFLHVSDAVAAFLAVLNAAVERFENGTVLDCGSGQPTSVWDFVKVIHKLTGSRATLSMGAFPYRDGEVMHDQADITALRELGWYPKVPLAEGLWKTLQEDARWRSRLTG